MPPSEAPPTSRSTQTSMLYLPDERVRYEPTTMTRTTMMRKAHRNAAMAASRARSLALVRAAAP